MAERKLENIKFEYQEGEVSISVLSYMLEEEIQEYLTIVFGADGDITDAIKLTPTSLISLRKFYFEKMIQNVVFDNEVINILEVETELRSAVFVQVNEYYQKKTSV